jgi:hypothetical protein
MKFLERTLPLRELTTAWLALNRSRPFVGESTAVVVLAAPGWVEVERRVASPKGISRNGTEGCEAGRMGHGCVDSGIMLNGKASRFLFTSFKIGRLVKRVQETES